MFSERLCFQILSVLTTGFAFFFATSFMLRIIVIYKHFLLEFMNYIHFFIVCRAFSTHKTGEMIDNERGHIKWKLDEYKQKLAVDRKNLEDPIDIQNDWVGKENGIKLWPKLYLTDITRLYGNVLDKKSIDQRMSKCKCKQGKAYRYFTDNFISELYYNNINDESNYCYLRTKCLSSKRVSWKSYDVWVLVKKNFKYEVGGVILSAYCTCTTGILGSCNYVTGLLFRMEAAVLIGVTHPTCTSMVASWNLPSD